MMNEKWQVAEMPKYVVGQISSRVWRDIAKNDAENGTVYALGSSWLKDTK